MYCNQIKDKRKEYVYLTTLVEYHRKQWRWVADETRKQQRRVYPKEYLEQLSGDDYKVIHSILKEVSTFEHNGWIACFYYKHCCGCIGLSSSDCTAYCPFIWDGDAWVDQQCWSHGTSYQKWKNATNTEELAEYAEKIARLRVANRSGIHYIV